jgi:uncharacterized membrane protein YbaN (DUF454 family)
MLEIPEEFIIIAGMISVTIHIVGIIIGCLPTIILYLH